MKLLEIYNNSAVNYDNIIQIEILLSSSFEKLIEKKEWKEEIKNYQLGKIFCFSFAQ